MAADAGAVVAADAGAVVGLGVGLGVGLEVAAGAGAAAFTTTIFFTLVTGLFTSGAAAGVRYGLVSTGAAVGSGPKTAGFIVACGVESGTTAGAGAVPACVVGSTMGIGRGALA